MKKIGMMLLALIALVVVPSVMARAPSPGAGNTYTGRYDLPAYNFAGVPVSELYAWEEWNNFRYNHAREYRTGIYGETSSAISKKVLTRNVFTQRAGKSQVKGISCDDYNNGVPMYDTALWDANCPRNYDVPGAYMYYMAAAG